MPGDRPPPNQVATLEQKVEQYAGPLPHPSTLKAFDEVIPGSAARIIDNWEKEIEHRRDLEKQDSETRREVIKKQVGIQGRGQIFGLIVALVGMGITGFAIHEGHPVAATILGSFDLVALVTVFVTGRGRRAAAPSDEKPSQEKAVARR